MSGGRLRARHGAVWWGPGEGAARGGLGACVVWSVAEGLRVAGLVREGRRGVGEWVSEPAGGLRGQVDLVSHHRDVELARGRSGRHGFPARGRARLCGHSATSEAGEGHGNGVSMSAVNRLLLSQCHLQPQGTKTAALLTAPRQQAQRERITERRVWGRGVGRGRERRP